MEILSQYLCCPSCHGRLEGRACTQCQLTFNQTHDILDLRWPQPTTVHPRETEIVPALLEQYDNASLEELIELMFAKISGPEQLLDVYQNYRGNLVDRGDQMMAMFRNRLTSRYPVPGNSLALDIGCGVGTAAVALTRQFEGVVGFDPTLSSLLLAQKYCDEQNIHNVLFVQAYAQHIPLRDGCVDYAVAQNVIEHLFDVETVFREIHRTLTIKGCFCGDSRNRFDLFFKEPHVKLRWLGYLPRSLHPWYAGTFRNLPYTSTHLLSLNELRRFGRAVFGDAAEVTFPLISTYGHSSAWDRLITLIERVPLLRTAILAVFPSHLLLARSK
jgi:ubiquinone/menaquinone biosynthesis C-methylase UbiE